MYIISAKVQALKCVLCYLNVPSNFDLYLYLKQSKSDLRITDF